GPNRAGTIASNEWSANGSPQQGLEDGGDELDKTMDSDAEGVWSPDIEQSFQEALAIYPPCGRRKIILSDEGKMYGRNELIARYIKLRTGKTRTRKQVSSHIQVLARKKVREFQAGIKVSSHLQVLARRKSREIQSKLKVCAFLRVGWGFAAFGFALTKSARTLHPGTAHSIVPFAFLFSNHFRAYPHTRGSGQLSLLTSTGRHSQTGLPSCGVCPSCSRIGTLSLFSARLFFLADLFCHALPRCPPECTRRLALLSPSPTHAQSPFGVPSACLRLVALSSRLDQASKDKALQNMASLSSAQIVSPNLIKSQLPPLPQPPYAPPPRFWSGPIPGQPGPSQDIKPFVHPYTNLSGPVPPPISAYEPLAPPLPPVATAVPVWQDRTIASSKLRMLEYSAFMEVPRDQDTYSKHLFVHIGQTNPSYSDPLLEAVDIRQIYDKFPEKKGGLKELYEKGPQNAFFLVKFWADLNSSDMQDGPGSFYGVSSQYCSTENMTITVSTKVCSFGKQVVEKVETEYARVEGGKCVYRIHRSPMCEYMINFIHKLKHLPEKYMMNSVLENFTILQVVTNRETQETLLCIAFVFEVSTSEHGAQYHVYRLIKD
ncbi:transcriptional enhancer factor TEF-5 isoform X5, partial [Silurus asotus]